jgi:hypothetical protein
MISIIIIISSNNCYYYENDRIKGNEIATGWKIGEVRKQFW